MSIDCLTSGLAALAGGWKKLNSITGWAFEIS